MKIFHHLLAVALSAFVIAALVSCKKAPAARPVPVEAPEQPQVVIRISAEDLDDEYEQDARTANDEYHGKLLEVTGLFDKAVRERDSITIEMLTVQGEPAIDCEFSPSAWEQIKQLKPKQPIIIRGRCIGLVDGTVTLEECVIMK